MDHNQNNLAARQRIVRTEEQILSILEEYDSSGFTPKEFAELSDINDATFYSWLKKYRSKPEEKEIKGFVKMEIAPAFKETMPALFAQIGNIKIYKELPVEYLKALIS